jgi:diacylglycerol kinase
MKQGKSSLQKRLNSFKFAFNGLKILFKEEPNARIHFFVSICVLIAGFAFRISIHEWVAVIFCIGVVIILELLNSSIENLADFVSPQRQDAIKKVKDLLAGAVLMGAIVASIVGVLVFLPKIIALFI